MTNVPLKLPIDEVIPALKETLQQRGTAVLVAPPGAGKTTRVPLAMLDEPWLVGRKIVMLEPRRLAARSAATYMAATLGESVGETVGYRVRMDTKVGPKTRIEVITEGVLTRLLQEDPALEDVGIVLFDEFHERSLHADLGLALCLQARSVLREDLRVLVMSATLEAEPVAALLEDAPILTSEGRAYPVETRYLERRVEGRKEPVVVRTIVEALEREDGDLLVFLPGAGEIRRVEALLAEQKLGSQVRVAPLHGSLSREAQDAALLQRRPGERKVVLATSIAETSLTVEGVRVVIDSGLMRVPRFSPRTGMTRLETVTVSRPSADQRQGRAGRQGPGVCYRLWTEQEGRHLASRSTPEILEADLAPLTLDLAAWGVQDPAELQWLDLPPAGAFGQARALLRQLGALDQNGKITPHGSRMAEIGLHPRLAHMVLQAIPLQLGGLACELAALLSERDFLRGDRFVDADVRLRVEVLRSFEKEGKGASAVDRAKGYNVDVSAVKRILMEARRWKREVGIGKTGRGVGNGANANANANSNAKANANTVINDSTSDPESCGLLLAFAYPDRIAMRRPNGRYLLRNGRGAAFLDQQALFNEPLLVAAELDDQGVESRIFLAAPVEQSDLEQHFGDQIEEETLITWDRSAQAVRARKRKQLGALVLQESIVSDPDPDEAVSALLQGIRQEGLKMLPWSKASRQLLQRLQFMHQHDPSWPDASDAALLATLEDWLAPHVYGLKSRNDLQSLNLVSLLESLMTWEQRRQLDDFVPTHIVVPSGSRIPVDYSDPAAPILAVRLQEMFGLHETPRIAGGRLPLTLHLLSPAQRPVQVTRDLASFWRDAYFEVKKDLKGRYPKHYWPDDPTQAMPTNRVRPRT